MAGVQATLGMKGDSVEADDHCAAIGGFYLGSKHQLIRRHLETIALRTDESASWRLQVDFELPTDPHASCRRLGRQRMFLFPLMFLPKSRGRTGFYARDEKGDLLPLPTRKRNDEISAIAAVRAADRLSRKGSKLSEESLHGVLGSVCREKPYAAFVVLNQLLNGLDPGVRGSWEKGGLADDLRMLVEHSLVWLPVVGLPGERRIVEVGHEIDLERRSILRWKFGPLDPPQRPRLHFIQAGKLKNPRKNLNTGSEFLARKSFGISFAGLCERLLRPLAWVPIQFEFPTIYTRRCDSYHFELLCPNGLSPRNVRLGSKKKEVKLKGRRTLRTDAAHLYLPGSRIFSDLVVRVTVAVGAGAFPILWFLAGALTSAMLWILAAADPTWLLFGTLRNTGKNEILASILLGGPAVLAALVVVEEGGIRRMLGGARVLLFVPALCSVVATSVLVGAEPFGFQARTTWMLCAAVATGATVPLATSWMISSPIVWHQLKKLKTTLWQYSTLAALVVLVAGVACVFRLDLAPWVRAVVAVAMLASTVPFLLLATNRAAVPINESRRYVAVSAASAAMIALAIGCVELRAAMDIEAHFHRHVEWVATPLLVVSLFTGLLLDRVTPGDVEDDVVDITPEAGRNVLRGESIGELQELREKTQSPAAADGGGHQE